MEGLLDQCVTNEMDFREMDLEANKMEHCFGFPCGSLPYHWKLALPYSSISPSS